METGSIGPDISKSALIIVDMQNDFLHRDGNFSHIAREHPEANIDLAFLIGTVPNVFRGDHLRLRLKHDPRWGRIQLSDDRGQRCRS
jgi:hypothetical protein